MPKEKKEPFIYHGKVYVSLTKNIGRGLFAKKNIKKGEIITTFSGGIKKVIIKNKEDSESFVGTHLLGLKRTLWLAPKKEDPLYYTNHSCNPNSGIKGAVRLYALRDISKDEEITFDYSTTEEDIYWSMECNCNSINCRKNIRSIQFLSEKKINEYLPCIPSYFKKVYLEYKSKK
jgi:uncharacterized protein